MRQILYISSSYPRGQRAEVGKILEQSRHNNTLDGVTGLLYTDGLRFLQVLEGPAESVEVTFQRIKADSRHHALVVLGDKPVEEREFGDWSMTHRLPGEARDSFDERVEAALRGVPSEVRGTILGLVAARNPA